MAIDQENYPISLHVNKTNGKYLFSIYDHHNSSMSFEVPFLVPDTMRRYVIDLYNQLVDRTAERKRDRGSALQASDSTQTEIDLAIEIGNRISNTLIPKRIIQAIDSLSPTSITLSTNDSDVPWELMRIEGRFACESIAIGKCLRSAEPPKRRQPYLSQRKLSVLLISDPTSDLPGAAHEHEVLSDYLSSDIHFICTSLTQADASLRGVSDVLMNSSFDIIHYAGHTGIDPSNPQSNHFYLADERISGDYFANLFRDQFPSLFFLNSCSSALITSPKDWNLYLEGIAPSFVRQGNSVVVGALWPVLDTTATSIALDFYASIGKGLSVGRALQKAKVKSQTVDSEDATWVGYSLVGDPEVAPISDNSWMITRSRTDGYDVVKKLAASDCGVGMVGLHPYLFLHERYDLKLIGVACECESTEGLVVAPGVQANTIEDLREIKIGYTPYTSLHALFLRMASHAGLSINQFKAIPMEKGELVTSLQQGSLHAAFLWEPWLTALLKRGFLQLRPSGFERRYNINCLVTTQQAVERHRDALARFLSQFNICVSLINSRQINYRQLLSIQFGLPMADIAAGVDKMTFLIIDAASRGSLTKQTASCIDEEVGFFRREGLVSDSFAFDGMPPAFWKSLDPQPAPLGERAGVSVAIQDSLTNTPLLGGRVQGYF